MVSSLTSALLLHWDSRSSQSLQDPSPSPTILSASPPRPALFPQATRLDAPDKDTLALIHNLAQYVHSLAQGKVGSGFDVSAAIYGSHVYRRFAVECLGDLLSTESTERVRLNSVVARDIPTDTRRRANRLPVGHFSALSRLSITLCGPGIPPQPSYRPLDFLPMSFLFSPTSTPAATRRVWSARFSHGKRPSRRRVRVDFVPLPSPSADHFLALQIAEQVWDSLKQSNSDLAESFRSLSKGANDDRDAYTTEVQRLSSTKSEKVRRAFGRGRGLAHASAVAVDFELHSNLR